LGNSHTCFEFCNSNIKDTKTLKSITFCFFLLSQLAYGQVNNVISVLDFGAIPDGKTLNTTALQKALDAVSKAKGKLYFPAGVYLSGTLFIKSDSEIELSSGAVILGSPNIEDYTKLTWGHHEDRTPWHLIVADQSKNIRIFGLGCIDGNGFQFWQKERKHEWAFYREIEERPSPMVEITDCENVIIDQITLRNSPG